MYKEENLVNDAFSTDSASNLTDNVAVLFNRLAGVLKEIPPIFNEAARGLSKALKIAQKGWAVVRWVFNDPSACRIRGDANNVILTRQRRRWRQKLEATRSAYTFQ